MIIRNSSTVRVNEPIWTHQRDAAPKSAFGGLDLSPFVDITLAAKRFTKNSPR